MTDRAIWIRSRHIWDEERGAFEAAALLVEAGKIKARTGYAETPPAAVEMLDLNSRYVLPGLINTHVHLEFSGSSRPLDDYLADRPGERLLRAAANANDLLMSGVTTARDCGSSWFTLALARRPDLAPQPLPRLLLSGPPITVPKGHLHFMEGVVGTDADIIAHIDRLDAEGGTSIKCMASGGQMTPGSDPCSTVFSQESLDLIAAEARRRIKPSVVHVLATESIRRSARARFDSLEHCAFFLRDPAGRIVRDYDAEVAALVRDSGAVVMANLSTATRWLDAMRERGPADETEAHALRQFDIMVGNLGRLANLGIPVVCGNDAGVRDTPFSDTWRELIWLEKAGLSAAEAIHSATWRAAGCLLLAKTTGRLRVGFDADLIAIDADPLADLSALEHPSVIMRTGDILRYPVAREEAAQ